MCMVQRRVLLMAFGLMRLWLFRVMYVFVTNDCKMA